MQRLLIGLLASCCLLTGCDNGPPPNHTAQGPAADVPQGLLPGGDAADLRQALATPLADGISALFVDEADQPLLLFTLDPQLLAPVLLANPETGMASRTALEEHNLQMLIGSGFVAELHSLQPVGLLQVDGQTLNPVASHGYTRILGINDQGMGVIHKAAYQRNLFHSAIQVGPGIVEAGQLDISERDLQRPRYFRSFVALCDARWVAGVSLAPTHLRTLGQTLLDVFRDQGWQCSEVVNLAGDRQAIAMVRTAAGVAFHGDPNTYKTSLLGFRSVATARETSPELAGVPGPAPQTRR